MTTESQPSPPASTPEPPQPEARSAPDAAAPSWRRNLAMRVAAGVPVLLGVLALVAWAPTVLIAGVVAVAAGYGLHEYIALLEADGRTRLPRPALLGGAALLGVAALTGSSAVLHGALLVAAALALRGVWFARGADEGDPLRDGALALLGVLLVPWLLNHVGLLAALPAGRGMLGLLVLAVSLSDTLAYLVGSFLGRHPLLPTVSPRKTVEGSLGGLAGGALAGLLATLWMAPAAFSTPTLLLAGVLLAAVSQAGDLLESKLKRLTGADDSGHFLPGHGGLLDRADGYLLAAPAAYYLLRLLG